MDQRVLKLVIVVAGVHAEQVGIGPDVYGPNIR
jgi:hypothetical protein